MEHDTYPCKRCGAAKPLTDYYLQNDGEGKPSRRSTMCRPCTREYRKARYDPERKSRYYRTIRTDPQRAAQAEHIWGYTATLRNVHGLSLDDYKAILERQHGCCAVCLKPSTRRLVVDHDHDTGQVRGLLCDPCNTAIGVLGDNEAGLLRALAYLRRT